MLQLEVPGNCPRGTRKAKDMLDGQHKVFRELNLHKDNALRESADFSYSSHNRSDLMLKHSFGVARYLSHSETVTPFILLSKQ